MLQELKSGEHIGTLHKPFDTIIGGDGKALKSKKELRLERKKRKLLALSAVMMLNEQQGVGKLNKSDTGPIEPNLAQQIIVSTQQSEAQLRKILVNNRTAFDITEEGNSPVCSDEGPLEAKRRKAEAANDENATSAAQSEDNSALIANPLNSEEEYRALKAYVSQKKNMRYSPRIVLKTVGQDALLDRPTNGVRIPLLLDDIQSMLMYALLRTDSPTTPRWVTIQKSTKLTHTVVLIVEGFGCEDYVSLREHMPVCSAKAGGIFGQGNHLQVVCPTTNLLEEMACVPLSDTHKDILVAEYGSLEAAMQVCKDQMLVRRSIFRNICKPEQAMEDNVVYDHLDLPQQDKFPRTQLLLSPIQMINESFPLPLTGTLQKRYKHYVTTSDFYLPVNPHSPMFGLDCEMCGTTGNQSVLTRVSVVDEAGKIVYDELVKPVQPIVDYRTKYSGITKEMLLNVTKRLENVQQELRQLLPRDAIIVGQSLNCDLEALQMMHPYVIDTSIVFNVTGTVNHKPKLRVLSKKFLQKDIQCGTEGHNPIEDCSASLSLVKLKLSKSIYFGDQWLQDRSKYHRFTMAGGKVGIASTNPDEPTVQNNQGDLQQQIMSTLFAHAKKRNKRSAIVTNDEEELSSFEAYFGNAIREQEGGPAVASSRQWLSFSRVSSADETVRKAAAGSLQYDFNLAHVKLPSYEQDSNDIQGDKVAVAERIDGWVKQLHNSLSVNGLLVVLLAGHEDQAGKANRMAVAMVQTKK